MSSARVTPLKPKEAERRLYKNGFEKLLHSRGADVYYIKMKDGKKVLDEDGKQIVTFLSFHPRDLGPRFLEKTIKRAKKTKEEWVSL